MVKPAIAKLFHAASDELLALSSDDLLVDRLFQAVDTRLRHAKLHVIVPFLPLQSLRRGAAGKTLAARNGNRRGRRCRCGGSGWGLRISGRRNRERRDDGGK